jgi:hypothetical protein
MHPIVLLGDRSSGCFDLVHLEIVPILTQDRCTVCAQRTLGSEIVLYAPDGTPRWQGQVEAQFSPFGDSANLDAR